MLDVGCGQGGFVRFLRGEGLDAYGVDWAVGHPESCFEVRSLLKEKRQFDVVTAIEVVEHVYDVHGLARKLSEIMVPGGLLYIETSDTVRAMKHQDLGLTNEWFDPPVHCVSYDLRSWSLLMRMHGFEILHDFSKEGGSHSLVVLARKK